MNTPILTNDLARAILDAVPVPVFVMDEDMRLLDANIAGAMLIGSSPGEFLRLRGGDALHCLQAGGNPGGCGHGEHCNDCIIRKAVYAAFEGQALFRQEAQMQLVKNGKVEDTRLWVTAAPFKYADRQMILLTLEDVTELLELRHLLPICAKCKKIRDDHQYWHRLEEYMQDNLHVDFTHGLCPDCLKELMPHETTITFSNQLKFEIVPKG